MPAAGFAFASGDCADACGIAGAMAVVPEDVVATVAGPLNGVLCSCCGPLVLD